MFWSAFPKQCSLSLGLDFQFLLVAPISRAINSYFNRVPGGRNIIIIIIIDQSGNGYREYSLSFLVSKIPPFRESSECSLRNLRVFSEGAGRGLKEGDLKGVAYY